MNDDICKLDRVAKTYVWHGEKCFFVSTIERESSAAINNPPRFNETIVWDYIWPNPHEGVPGGRGDQIFEDWAPKGSLVTHQKIVDSLHKTGKPE